MLSAGCATSAISDPGDDVLFDDAGPSSLLSPPQADAESASDGGAAPSNDAAVASSAMPLSSDSGAGASAADAGTTDAGRADAAVADAAVADAGSHDAGTSDAGATKPDAGTSGGSCVASQCNVSCLTKVCCSVLNQCACEDLLGLCVLPAL